MPYPFWPTPSESAELPTAGKSHSHIAALALCTNTFDSPNSRCYFQRSLPSCGQPHTGKEIHVVRIEWAPLKPRDRFEGGISSQPFSFPCSKHASASSCCLKATSQTSPPGRHAGQFNYLIKMALTVNCFVIFFSFVVKGQFAHKENFLKGFKSTLVEAMREMLNDMSKYHSCSFKQSQFVL